MKKRAIRRAERQIHDGDLEHRSQKIEEWRQRGNEDVTRLEGRIADVARDYRVSKEKWTGHACPATENPHPDLECGSLARWYTVAAVAAVLFESLLAGFVSSYTLELKTWQAVMVGVLFAVLLTLIAKGALKAHVYDRDLPHESYHKAKTWASVCFFASVVFVAILFASRNLLEVAFLLPVALAGLSVSFPLLGGSLLVAAFIVEFGRRSSREYERVGEELAETRSFLGKLPQIVPAGVR